MFSLFLILLSCVLLLFYRLKRKKNYWVKRGVFQIPPHFFFGNTMEVFQRKVSLGQKFQELYNIFKNENVKFAGAYVSSTPVLVPIDMDIVSDILRSNFGHFSSHGIYVDEKNDILTGQLFNLEGTKWKTMRNKLTPAFSSSKMKMMFETMVKSTEDLSNLLKEELKINSAIEVKEIMARYSTDVIGSCAFGIECNSLKNSEAEIRTYGRKVFESRFSTILKMYAIRLFPKWFLQLIRFKITRREVRNFFIELVKETVEYREKNNIFRKDLMHLLLQLKNRGRVTDDEHIFSEEKNSELTINELIGQCYGFFTAGFETSATTMAFALYELAVNKTSQEIVRKEINTMLSKYDNKITYEAVQEMHYLEKILLETLRLHPPIPGIPRQCTKNYTIPDTNITIGKKARVHISILGIHMDPDYYPDPTKFDPERFSEEQRSLRPPCSYLPFGEGPRICIGMKFGLQQSKIGLISILRDYQISLDTKTIVPLQMEPTSFINTAKGGIWLKMKPLL